MFRFAWLLMTMFVFNPALNSRTLANEVYNIFPSPKIEGKHFFSIPFYFRISAHTVRET